MSTAPSTLRENPADRTAEELGPQRNGKGRLAIFLPNLGGGGAERVMLNLAEGVAGRGHPTDLVLAGAAGEYQGQVPPGVRQVDLGGRRTLRSARRLAAYLRRERPTALISALGHANIVALWARRLARVDTAVVVTEHLALQRQPAHTLAERVFPPLVRLEYPRAAAVVAVSEGVADAFAAVTGLGRELISVIYNPVVTPRLLDLAARPPEHPWFQPGEPPVVLGVGRLTAQKDFATLIRAFARVRRRAPARLLILGEGEDRASLEAEVARNGLRLGPDVQLPGFVANPYPYMAGARVFALSSVREGLPTVLIEALAVGATVVSTDCPSGPREILAGGRHGRLVPVGDAPALAAALGEALEEPARRPARDDAWAAFTRDAAVTAYLRAAGVPA